ncbi:uncharacterized protein B0I36DRAFT_364791 [Microdochium trichocladiopsis]|uniref:SET domain-containing protein n=1 Tax=Microdochium trichocladiopsis TaxID=1682393 RepID=A0A9P9BND8_9PEZI|nr:uncharacterized protein B0I36DRAFT_364791 [Microdochium trichocladiopsis]KAH7027611.1 hypothetical protein B0I36DRAFT_364791 [Microdochium trichocladiopsis]
MASLPSDCTLSAHAADKPQKPEVTTKSLFPVDPNVSSTDATAPTIPVSLLQASQQPPPLFEVRPSPLGGSGVFATRDLSFGTRLLAEEALFYADRTTLYEEVDKLSPEARRMFDDLHSFRRTHGTDDIAARFWTNCFHTPLGSGIFPLSARFNHACKGHNNVAFTLPKASPSPGIGDGDGDGSDGSKSNHSKSNHSKSNHSKSNHSKSNHSKSNHSKSNHSSRPPENQPPGDADKLLVLSVSVPDGVKAGQELTINYGPPPAVLFVNWGFRCRCAGCRRGRERRESASNLSSNSSRPGRGSGNTNTGTPIATRSSRGVGHAGGDDDNVPDGTDGAADHWGLTDHECEKLEEGGWVRLLDQEKTNLGGGYHDDEYCLHRVGSRAQALMGGTTHEVSLKGRCKKQRDWNRSVGRQRPSVSAQW